MACLSTKPGHENLAATLARHFPGIATLRDRQGEAIQRTAAGESLVYIAPTGMGKSLVYQIAGALRGGLVLVISPLRALIAQQTDRLRESGFQAERLHGAQSSRKQLDILTAISRMTGVPRFLLISPERAFMDGMLEYTLRRLAGEVSLVVIDEAHCVSQWGDSFRPSYRAIPDFLDRVFSPGAWPPRLCLTATLNPADREEILADFCIPATGVVESNAILRTNLSLAVETHDDEPAKLDRLTEWIAADPRAKTLVYTHRKAGEWGTRAMAERFREAGYNCDYFDADREEADKARVLDQFHRGTLRLVFATSAFGMGIDIPDIRRILHYLVPESIAQYYQEAGRGGRDGAPAQCLLLYSPVNITVRQDQIRAARPTRETARRLLETLSLGPTPRGFPNTDIFAADTPELLALHQLIRQGIIRVDGRAFATIRDFQPVGRDNTLEHLMGHSRSGLLTSIANATGQSLDEIRDQLLDAHWRGSARLTTGPSKSIHLTLDRQPTADDFDALDTFFGAATESRLAAFANFTAGLHSGEPLEKMISRDLLGVPSV